MNITLSPNEKLVISFAESESDVFIIEYNDTPNGSEIKIVANLADNQGREGVIYHEQSVIDVTDKIIEGAWST